MQDFVSSALVNVTHSDMHRPQIGEHVKADKEGEEPKTWAPPNKTVAAVRKEGTSVQMCKYSSSSEQWINGHCAVEKRYRDNIGGIPKHDISEIPEWLQEFRENLVDDRVRERRAWIIFRAYAYENCGFG